MADSSRLADLERRVERDPASIAFAQLAEEYRRAGRFDDAVRVCRAGLAQHPAYPSAQVTLARALLALGQVGDAQSEIDAVAREAPDHIALRRVLDDVRRVRGGEALAWSDPALSELESWLQAIITDRATRHHVVS